MTPGSVFTASATRRRLFEELEKIKNDPSYTTTITHRGKPTAVLTNYDQFQSLRKTVAVAADPLLVRNLENLKEEFRAGNVITYQELFGKPQPNLGPMEKNEIVYRVRHGAYQEQTENEPT